MPILPKVSIIILTYNNLDYTRMCLESIFAKTQEPDFEVVIVDNASQDKTPLFLQEFARAHPNVKLVLNQYNQGFARGNNMGVEVAAGDYLVFLNNDVVVTQGWLSGLLGYLQDPTVGMVGPVTNSAGNESRIEIDYKDLNDMDAFAARYTSAHAGQAFEIQMMPFQCVALRRSVFDEIGPLDERFGIGMFEDDDYALRLRQKGYRILCAEDVFIHHWGSISFSKLAFKSYWRLFKENLKKFEQKWGVTWLPPTQRPQFIPQQIRQVLDGSIWMTEIITERERTIEDLRSQLADRIQTINFLNSQLTSIYASNGWIFLQAMLRFRRWLIPEGSRRERFLRLGIDMIRNVRHTGLNTIWLEAKDILRSGEKTYRPVQDLVSQTEGQQPQVPVSAPAELSWLPERFPWPLVSVILPVFNHADMLEGAAWSVLDNSYPNLELIVLDDGSTDAIEPVLKRLKANPRVRVYRQPNQKLPRALTHAHRFTRGDFITWTSADNLLDPRAVQEMVIALLKHPEAVLVYGDVAVIDDEGKRLEDGSYRPQNLDPTIPGLVRLYRNAQPLGYEADNYINACFLYRREAAQALEGRYADDLRGLEDYDFWLRLQKSGLSPNAAFRHMKNPAPLYYYRSHPRTMSHELLTRKLEEHVKRSRQLMEYEAGRREFANQRWALILDSSLSELDKRQIEELANQVPVDLLSRENIPQDGKRIRFISETSPAVEPVSVQVLPETWRLAWLSRWTGSWQNLDVWRGIHIHPLALKAREHHKNVWEFPQAGERQIVGCQAGLANLPVDLETTHQVIRKNPQSFFVFVDTPGQEDPELGRKMVADLENAVYLGTRPFGEPYQLYACFDALWLPPLSGEVSEHAYRTILALAYSIARPLIAPRGFNFIPAPYQLYYHTQDETLDFIQSIHREWMDTDLLDRYLEAWRPSSRLEQTLRNADTIMQDIAVSRPDFGIESIPVVSPVPWSPPVPEDNARIKCALAINTLDTGGLEEMVAQLACRLPQHNVETFVLCIKSGGVVADRLKDFGLRVYTVEDRQSEMREILKKEKPDVVNSHWASLDFLKIAGDLGLPVIETIQNAYVWLNREGWMAEQKRSRYFSHAIAVSELVKKYYLKWNNAFLPQWITTIPNGIDPGRMVMVDRDAARQELGFSKNDFVFVSLASYDGRKNQLGLLTAFDEVFQRFSKALLLCAGNIASPEYHAQVHAYREKLHSKDRILLYEYRQDTARLLSAADAFVLNSFFEGWSLAATEALLMGLPLILSECGSARELVGAGGERGIIVPNPAQDPLDLNWDTVSQTILQKRQTNLAPLVQAMSQMIQDREHWELKRSMIREEALVAFNMDHILRKYHSIFVKVCGE